MLKISSAELQAALHIARELSLLERSKDAKDPPSVSFGSLTFQAPREFALAEINRRLTEGRAKLKAMGIELTPTPDSFAVDFMKGRICGH
jgi:hypothetical protein